MTDLLAELQAWTSGLPPAVQVLAVALLGAIPFVESYLGAVIGVVAGVHPVLAIAAAVLGDLASTTLAVVAAARVRGRRPGDGPPRGMRRGVGPDREAAGGASAVPDPAPSRGVRWRELFDRHGVPGVSMFGQLLAPGQVTAATLVALGQPLRRVLRWQALSVTVWGVVYGALAAFGVNLVR